MGMQMFSPLFCYAPKIQAEALYFAHCEEKVHECENLLKQSGLYSAMAFENLCLIARLESDSSEKCFTDCLREITDSYINRRIVL